MSLSFENGWDDNSSLTEQAVLNIFVSLFRLELYFVWFCCLLPAIQMSYFIPKKEYISCSGAARFPTKYVGRLHVALRIRHLLCHHVHFHVQTQIVALGQPHVYFAGLHYAAFYCPFP